MLQRPSMLLPALFAITFFGQSLQAVPALIFNPSSTTLSGSSGSFAVAQTVTLINSGDTATDWSLAVDATATWLTASPASGKALAAGASVTITVTANPANLKPNSSPGYMANIRPQGTAVVVPLSVTFNVIGTAISVSPNPIALSILAGTQQAFANVAQINGNANVTITVTSGAWLVADGSATTPAPFSIGVNALNLTPSTTPYQGSLLIQCASGPTCIAQTVPVNLTVYSPATLTCSPTTGPTQVGVPYSTKCTAAGGDNSYLWSISLGSLPAGITLSSNTGSTIQVSGTPTTAGPYKYTLYVVDRSVQAPQSATQVFSGTIAPAAPPTLTASPSSLSFGSYIVGGTAPASQKSPVE